MLAVSLVECGDGCGDRLILRCKRDPIARVDIQSVRRVSLDCNQWMRGVGSLLRGPPLTGHNLIARRRRIRRGRPGELYGHNAAARSVLEMKLLKRRVVDRRNASRDHGRNLRLTLYARLPGEQRPHTVDLVG